MTVHLIGRATQRKLTKEQRASAWAAGLAGNYTGCLPHISLLSDLDKKNPVAT